MKVLLIDDHSVYSEGLRYLVLSTFPKAEIATVSSLEEAMNTALNTDLIVLDIFLRGDKTLEMIPALREHHPNAHILTITGYDNPEHNFQAQQNGADGFVYKKDTPDEIEATLRLVASGKKVFPAEGATSLSLSNYRALNIENLTQRESQIVSMTAKGCSNLMIADQLEISVKTVKTHLTNSYRKLGVASRMEAAALLRSQSSMT